MYCFTGIVFVLGFNALAAKFRLLMEVKWDNDSILLQTVITYFLELTIFLTLPKVENFKRKA